MEFDGEAFGAEIVAAVKSYVGRELALVVVQVEQLAAEVKLGKGERGERGEQGEKGEHGETGIAGRDGKDGKDGEPGLQGEDCVPIEISDEVAKAVALLAESPALHQASKVNPVVVNFSPANTVRKSKTITTRRDDKGNLVARVVEDSD